MIEEIKRSENMANSSAETPAKPVEQNTNGSSTPTSGRIINTTKENVGKGIQIIGAPRPKAKAKPKTNPEPEPEA